MEWNNHSCSTQADGKYCVEAASWWQILCWSSCCNYYLIGQFNFSSGTANPCKIFPNSRANYNSVNNTLLLIHLFQISDKNLLFEISAFWIFLVWKGTLRNIMQHFITLCLTKHQVLWILHSYRNFFGSGWCRSFLLWGTEISHQ